jgi:hypothetical protein
MSTHRPCARAGALFVLAVAASVLVFPTPGAAEAAAFGSRTLREGASGSDVKSLQRYLARAGFATSADGQFGPRTERSVMRFERSAERRVNGVVSRSDARALRRSVRQAKQQRSGGQPALEEATLAGDGTALAPAGAPPEVVEVIEAGNRISTKPYKYGGGHRRWRDSGYDCSGSVSYALHGGGLLDSPLDSSGFMRYGRRGRGRWITVYGNSGHAYMVVAGLRFDTSGRGQRGTRWTDVMRSPRGFVKRHPPGL